MEPWQDALFKAEPKSKAMLMAEICDTLGLIMLQDSKKFLAYHSLTQNYTL